MGLAPGPEPAPEQELPLVFVTVGTDHHPFHRVVDWVDRWMEGPPASQVRCLVQFGTSRPPHRAEHRDYVSYQEMERLTGEAAAVVCHGGPGSVMLVRWAGKKPIVVPRRRALGEHVDDHQVVFSRRMAQEGELEMADDESSFRDALDRALGGDPSFSLPPPEAGSAAALHRFEQLVEDLVRVRPPSARTGGRRGGTAP